MIRKVLFTLFIIAALFVPVGGMPVANAAAPETVALAISNGMVDIWAFVDADQNGIYSTGDNGLTDVSACLAHSDLVSCVGTDSGDTWWEDLEAGDYVGSIDATTLPAGYQLASIRCEPTGSRVEYAGCQYDLNNLEATFSLLDDTRINIFFALTASSTLEEPQPIGTGYVDIWAFIDVDQNGVYSSGDDGLTDVSACLNDGVLVSCVGTDLGDTWWEDLGSGDYVGSINAATLPAGYQLASIRCEDTITRVEYAGCQYDLNNLKTAFSLPSGTRINIFFALAAATTAEESKTVELELSRFVFLPFLRAGSAVD